MKNKTLRYGSVFFAALFLILAKVAGALGKIPLTSLMGSAGAGVYQAAFPLFGFTISLSSGGLHACVSTVVASAKTRNSPLSRATLRLVLIITAIFSIAVALALFFAAPTIAALQRLPDTAFVYRALAPAIVAVALSSVIRGWLSGNGYFATSAAGELISQSAKALLCIMCVSLCLRSSAIPLMPSVAAIGVTLSEFISLACLLLVYNRRFDKTNARADVATAKSILSKSVPLCASGLITPLCGFFESFIVLNCLSATLSTTDCSALYGLKEGIAGALLALPTAIYSAMYSYFLPALSAKNHDQIHCAMLAAFSLAGIFFGASFFSLSDGIIAFLYPALPTTHSATASLLLKLGSGSVIMGALSQASTALLHSNGILWQTTAVKLVGSAIKLAGCAVFTPLLGINGAMLALTIGSATSALCLLFLSAIRTDLRVRVGKLLAFAPSALAFALSTIFLRQAFSSLPVFWALALTEGCALTLSVGLFLARFAFIKGAEKLRSKIKS